jgi:hypothetical protein
MVQDILFSKVTVCKSDDPSSIPSTDRKFSFRYHVQPDSPAHPSPYPMGTENVFPLDEAWEAKVTTRVLVFNVR